MKTERWATIPAVGAVLLPKLVCPLCWPAYAAVASALGFGFLVHEQYLFAVNAAMLLVVLGFLSFRARLRRGYWPAVLGYVSSVVILAGKFAIGSPLALYCGIAMLIGASVWNAWPTNNRSCCPQAR